MEVPPNDWFEDLPLSEIAGVLGRYALMKELRLDFTDKKMRQIARNEMPENNFWGAIHKTFAGLNGNGVGLHLADVEVAADMLGVYEDVFGYRSKAA